MSEKIDTRYILQHIPSGFYVTGADSYTERIGRAKLYETNADRTPPEWAEKMATDDYKIIMRTETHTVRYEEAPF